MSKPRRFAAATSVSVEKSKAELSTLLARHGASQTGFFDDNEGGRAVVMFKMAGRQIRLSVRLPSHDDKRFTRHPRHDWMRAPDKLIRERWEQECRAVWRRVLLVTKAKLEIVADGESTLEREFLADVLLPDGRTVHEALADKLVEAYSGGTMPPLLPAYGGES